MQKLDWKRKKQDKPAPCRVITYIGLGSNLGDRKANIEKALSLLNSTEGIKVSKTASLHETEPEGVVDQPRFLNTAAEVETSLGPEELLAALAVIESKLGRTRTSRWGPRTIDLDILLYGGKIVRTDALSVPHPLMARRTFVLEPLAEIAPRIRHPALKKTVEELLEQAKK